jgi:predicted 3-demethylubiquinone-9 3-methyltransferase (glyoxalase superfamily)
MQKISPFLWCDGNAEEMMNFYLGVFRNAKALEVVRYTEAGPGPVGAVMLCSFELDGQRFSCLNAGPQFPYTNAVSFVIDCADQAEVDYYWERLTADGGKAIECGWLTDKFGLPWQVTPRRLVELIASPDKAVAARVMAAMMTMVKIDLAAIEAAARG